MNNMTWLDLPPDLTRHNDFRMKSVDYALSAVRKKLDALNMADWSVIIPSSKSVYVPDQAIKIGRFFTGCNSSARVPVYVIRSEFLTEE